MVNRYRMSVGGYKGVQWVDIVGVVNRDGSVAGETREWGQ